MFGFEAFHVNTRIDNIDIPQVYLIKSTDKDLNIKGKGRYKA